MKSFIKILKTSKILFPIFIVSVFLGIFLFIYIPKVMEAGITNNIVKNSKNSVERLQMEREYYTQSVLRDVKKFAPNISFDYEHEGIDGKLPFPTTTIHDLSKMYSQRSGIKFQLYSNYPFLNRKDRVLTDFQKEALRMVEKNEDGIYYKKDTIDGKQVLRVAIADRMIQPACVNCHNTHKLKNWDADRWKLGDKRGVLEIITPIDEAIGEMQVARNKVVLSALAMMLVLFIYYTFTLLKRESELYSENEMLTEDFKDLFEVFDNQVIASKTDLNGTITYASKKFAKVSEYDIDELVGHNHRMIRDPQMPNELFEQMWDNITNDKMWKGEVRNRKKSGAYYWVKAVISPLYDHENKKIGYSAIRQDITDKKKIEELNNTLELKINEAVKEVTHLNQTLEKRVQNEVEKNRQKEQKLLEQSRFAAMGEMIGNIAHQWRQPLSAINSVVTGMKVQLELKLANTEDINNSYEKIMKYVEFLNQTIEDFRGFFKEDKEKTTFNLTSTIKNVMNITNATYQDHGIKVKTNFDQYSHIELTGYKNELSQVFLNILNNAKDALVQNSIKDKIVYIQLQENQEKVTINIYDNALGIPQHVIDKIFDPYFTTKHQSQGTGIGLYMSREIIEKHMDGVLSVKNIQTTIDDIELNGACFSINLPK